MASIGRWQMQEFTSWMGTTKSNHINAAFGGKPQLATQTYIRLMEQKYGRNAESYLNRFPTKYFEEDEDIVWKLIGSARQNIPLYEARDFNGNVVTTGMVGANTEPFYLVFQKAWFADGNIVVNNQADSHSLTA